MYIGSLLRNMFKPKNLLATLYMLVNNFIIFELFGAFQFFQIDPSNNFLFNGLIGIAINCFFMLFSLSPFGEMLLRRKMHVTVVDDNQKYLLDTFNEVYQEAQKNSKHLSKKVKLYYSNSEEINAFALGHRTLIVTQGLLDSANNNDLKGVMAHEFGHLSNGDSDMTLAININNTIILVFMLILALFGKFLKLTISMIKDGASIGRFIDMFISALIFVAYTLWTKLGMLLLNFASRKEEYLADGFAVTCGEANGLYCFLDKLEPVKVKNSPLALLGSTHPDTVNRLARIKEAAILSNQHCEVVDEEFCLDNNSNCDSNVEIQ